jgi:hypothetical protein
MDKAQPTELPPDAPQFEALDQALAEGLRARGLTPQRVGDREWDTGVPGLRLTQGEVGALRAREGLWIGYTEFVVSVEHPTHGKHRIQDLVRLNGASGTEVLTECLSLYLYMTLDPILSLFNPALFADPDTELLSVVDPGPAMRWNVYSRFVDVRGPDQAPLLQRLEEVPMLRLVGSTLADRLRQPKLHWFKLYGEDFGSKQEYGCIFDGLNSRGGEREMQASVNLPPGSGRWALRAFALLVPGGESDTEEAQALRAELGPPRKSLLARLAPRVIWKITAVKGT